MDIAMKADEERNGARKNKWRLLAFVTRRMGREVLFSLPAFLPFGGRERFNIPDDNGYKLTFRPI